MLTQELKEKIKKVYIPIIILGALVFSIILLPNILEYHIWYKAVLLALFRSTILMIFLFLLTITSEMYNIYKINNTLKKEPFNKFLEYGFKYNDHIYIEGWFNDYYCVITWKKNHSKNKERNITIIKIYFLENNKIDLKEKLETEKKYKINWSLGVITKIIKSKNRKLPKHDLLRNHILKITNLLRQYKNEPISFEKWFYLYGKCYEEAENIRLDDRSRFRFSLFKGKLDLRILKSE